MNDNHAEAMPPPDDEMRAAGLEGRGTSRVGNHEVLGDPNIEGRVSRRAVSEEVRRDS